MYSEDNRASHAPLASWRGPARLEVYAGTVMTAIMAVIVLILLSASAARACSDSLDQGVLPAGGASVIEKDMPCAAEASAVVLSGYDQLRYVVENGHATKDALQSMLAVSASDGSVAPRIVLSSEDQLRYVVENGHATKDALQSMAVVSQSDEAVAPRIVLSPEDQLRYVVENGHVTKDALQNLIAANESRATSAFRNSISPEDQFRYVMQNGHVSADVWAMVQGLSPDVAATQQLVANDTP